VQIFREKKDKLVEVWRKKKGLSCRSRAFLDVNGSSISEGSENRLGEKFSVVEDLVSGRDSFKCTDSYVLQDTERLPNRSSDFLGLRLPFTSHLESDRSSFWERSFLPWLALLLLFGLARFLGCLVCCCL